MPADPLRIAFNKKTGLKLGRRLYSGNGEIYTIAGHSNRVVKIVIPYNDSEIKDVMCLCRYLKRSKTKCVVKLFQFGYLKVRNHINCYGEVDTAYYYVMEKLRKIPYTIANRILDQVTNYDNPVVRRHIPANVKTFVKSSDKLKYVYGDLHDGNIMKNSRGSIKFVDLEGFDF